MTDSKLSDQKEKHTDSKTKSWQPKRKTSEMERIFQESTRKHFKNHSQTYLKIIDSQLEIELRQFTELGAVLKQIKTKIAASLDEMPREVWKIRICDDIFLWVYNVV